MQGYRSLILELNDYDVILSHGVEYPIPATTRTHGHWLDLIET